MNQFSATPVSQNPQEYKTSKTFKIGPNNPVYGEDGDRQGFSLECYRYIKQNSAL